LEAKLARYFIMAGLRPNQVHITPNDQGPLLAIITWFFMVMMILAVIFRLAVKLGIRGNLKFDDFVLCAALVRTRHVL
jgi:hypothetical protein